MKGFPSAIITATLEIRKDMLILPLHSPSTLYRTAHTPVSSYNHIYNHSVSSAFRGVSKFEPRRSHTAVTAQYFNPVHFPRSHPYPNLCMASLIQQREPNEASFDGIQRPALHLATLLN
jgi:hypothetical protein